MLDWGQWVPSWSCNRVRVVEGREKVKNLKVL